LQNVSGIDFGSADFDNALPEEYKAFSQISKADRSEDEFIN
jgi:hypothetical protein